jgi:Zn-dependent protease
LFGWRDCAIKPRRMLPTRQGSIRLFRLLGIDVFLHWSWFLIAIFQIRYRPREYTSLTWNILEYVTLFLIVLMHEFGHALACRQVGGQANQIVLWPLGGVAYVAPPQRPGAVLWSIAAGPLVNLILVPLLILAWLGGRSLGWPETLPNFYIYVRSVCVINGALLVFNLLPVYPLDGGQILRALLWFIFGRSRSLMIASGLGFVGVIGLALFAFFQGSAWLAFISVFVAFNCWRGWTQARALARIEDAPRREGFACPTCKTAPPIGLFWGCGRCRKAFDTFETQAACPHCGAQYSVTACLHCGNSSPIGNWAVSLPPVPPKFY